MWFFGAWLVIAAVGDRFATLRSPEAGEIGIGALLGVGGGSANSSRLALVSHPIKTEGAKA